MTERSTYPMSALFLLVTLVGVVLAMAFAAGRPRPAPPPDSPRATYGRQSQSSGGAANDDQFWSLAPGAFCGGILGLIVMAYQTWRWERLVLSYLVGVAIGAAAVHYLVSSSGARVPLAGATVLIIYGIVVRFSHVLPRESKLD